jgi:hypothetical protein
MICSPRSQLGITGFAFLTISGVNAPSILELNPYFPPVIRIGVPQVVEATGHLD